MGIVLPSFEERVAILRKFVNRLFENQDLIVQAVVADGWPAPMVREGFALHQKTWNVDILLEALHRELAAFGGVAALERPSNGWRIIAPERIVHVWPALPGAGVTPCFYGWLLGAWQSVRASRRGRFFAQMFGEVWLSTAGMSSIDIDEGPRENWSKADVIVVSGADDTIDAVRQFLGDTPHRRPPIIIGYGHRVSFAVIDDDGTDITMRYAADLARDIVMWDQKGCLSARAVFFRGDHKRLEAFGAKLGEEIKRVELELDAVSLTDEDLARRAQAKGVAEFMNQTWGDGIGWVQSASDPFTGEIISPHTVPLYHIDRFSEFAGLLPLPERQIQGVALGVGDRPAVHQSWCEVLARAGATYICKPGDLQSPHGAWPHDGWPNVLDWVRVCKID